MWPNPKLSGVVRRSSPPTTISGNVSGTTPKKGRAKRQEPSDKEVPATTSNISAMDTEKIETQTVSPTLSTSVESTPDFLPSDMVWSQSLVGYLGSESGTITSELVKKLPADVATALRNLSEGRSETLDGTVRTIALAYRDSERDQYLWPLGEAIVFYFRYLA